MFKSLFTTAAVLVLPVFSIVASSAVAAPMPTNHNCTNATTSAKLQDKIDKAAEGDVIEISGDCTETNYVIAKDRLTLRGVGVATITGDGGAPALTITGHQVTVENWAKIDGGADRGIVVRAGGAARVSDISSIAGADAMFVTESSFAEIDYLLGIDTDDDGIQVDLNASVRITNSNISGADDDGIIVVAGGAAHIAGGNMINYNDGSGVFFAGGHVAFSGSNTVQENDQDKEDEQFNNDIRCSSFSRLSIFDLITSSTHTVYTGNGSCAAPQDPHDIFNF